MRFRTQAERLTVVSFWPATVPLDHAWTWSIYQ
jgi:hypothetical protein